MTRFRNETGGVLKVNDLMLTAGPGEEFDWPGHDPAVHGVIPGCAQVDPAKDKAGVSPETGDGGRQPAKSGKAADKESGK